MQLIQHSGLHLKQSRLKQASLLITIILLSACSTEKVAVVAPPEPVYVPIPLITLERADPILHKKRGPVGANIQFTNSSTGIYQYILFRTTAYDKEGNVVRARRSRDESAYLRVAGPVLPGTYRQGHSWKNTWSKSNVHCLDIDEIEIVFSDGSVEVASGDTLIKTDEGACIH
ncbi:hypothetical protein [Neptunomonas antarctica]|uniref:Uncharacterized protein n=1 Tax=Neptunomonas antarctica TaxID=619304 RepID=A0A1N7J866_9GAMM|nr:hypothetical protein [Neptunomonas antarctica]SIS45563.1 hypothetical protein SAMN05421760_101756 [Neptunomonas antarctica]